MDPGGPPPGKVLERAEVPALRSPPPLFCCSEKTEATNGGTPPSACKWQGGAAEPPPHSAPHVPGLQWVPGPRSCAAAAPSHARTWGQGGPILPGGSSDPGSPWCQHGDRADGSFGGQAGAVLDWSRVGKERVPRENPTGTGWCLPSAAAACPLQPPAAAAWGPRCPRPHRPLPPARQRGSPRPSPACTCSCTSTTCSRTPATSATSCSSSRSCRWVHGGGPPTLSSSGREAPAQERKNPPFPGHLLAGQLAQPAA